MADVLPCASVYSKSFAAINAAPIPRAATSKRQTTLDQYLTTTRHNEARASMSSSTELVKAKHPLSHTPSFSKRLRGEDVGTPPPPYPATVALQPNHRVGTTGLRGAVEIIDFTDQQRGDRVEIPKSWAARLMPVLGYEDGKPTLALSNVEADQLLSVPMKELKALAGSLSATKLRVRWWKDGRLVTARPFKYKANTVSMSAAGTLALMMRARGSDIAAHRLLSLAPKTVTKEVEQLSNRDNVSSTRLRTILTDAVVTMVGPISDGVEREVATAAGNAVARYLRQQSASQTPEKLVGVLRTILTENAEVRQPEAAGAFIGIVLGGVFKYISKLETDRSRVIKATHMGVSIGLSFLEEAPGGKVASRILTLAFDAAAEAAQERGYKHTREAVRNFIIDKIKFPLNKYGYLPGMEDEAIAPYDQAQVTSLLHWLNLALESNGFGSPLA